MNYVCILIEWEYRGRDNMIHISGKNVKIMPFGEENTAISLEKIGILFYSILLFPEISLL